MSPDVTNVQLRQRDVTGRHVVAAYPCQQDDSVDHKRQQRGSHGEPYQKARVPPGEHARNSTDILS
jgi:hypothetical protein